MAESWKPWGRQELPSAIVDMRIVAITKCQQKKTSNRRGCAANRALKSRLRAVGSIISSILEDEARRSLGLEHAVACWMPVKDRSINNCRVCL
jgi:hypothetical protein